MTLRQFPVVLMLTAVSLASAACVSNQRKPIPLRASAFNPVENTDLVFADAGEVIDYYLVGTGRTAPTTRSVDSDPKGDADLLVIFSAEGYEDDSVAAEQWRVSLAKVDLGYIVIKAGVRYRCYRDRPTQWRKALCP